MLILLSILGLLAVIFFAAKRRVTNQFQKEVHSLFSRSANISNQTFQSWQIQNLPEPVQRYFKYTLKEGQPYVSYVRLKHDGLFKTHPSKDWENIRGEQYFTTEKPGFIWKGSTTLFTACDSYIAQTGKLMVSLFSAFPILNAGGEKTDQGELLRWLGESVWFPTNLLPAESLRWEPIDDASAKLVFTHSNLSVFYTVTFNEMGEITELETKRYKDQGNLETWVGKLSDYKEISGMRIPTRIEGIWRLEKEESSYARFHLQRIEYNLPRGFFQ